MRGRVVMVLEEPEFNDQTSAALRRAGYEVVAFLDPTAAVSALAPEQHTDILATRAHFASEEQGVSLVRLARTRNPGIQVLFTGVPGSEDTPTELGEFVRIPFSVQAIVEGVGRLMKSRDLTIPSERSAAPA